MTKIKSFFFAILLILPLSFTSCELLTMMLLGGMGTDSLEISEYESEQLMKSLAESKGYEIEFKYSNKNDDGESESGTGIVAARGNVEYVKLDSGDEAEGYATISTGSGYIYYYFDNDSNSWVLSDTDRTNTGSGSANYTEFFYLANTMDGGLKKNGSKKVAGRNCIDYKGKMDFSALAKLSGAQTSGKLGYSYEFAVDQELGITLYADMDASAEGESGSVYFEVTKFTTGSAFTFPFSID
jgi:outer membrane lipoprotein-sorting protein